MIIIHFIFFCNDILYFFAVFWYIPTTLIPKGQADMKAEGKISAVQ